MTRTPSLRRFGPPTGKPFELFFDQDMKFKGGKRELKETFDSLQPDLRAQLASQQIKFTFNLPRA